ncbi:MAG: T9SS type A sorting domain-containing protein, partial [Saprospiraceae bacterium]|nr:T9SS type A sorting domain-containing protein [Saprospiraceae bacterium]
ILPLGLCGQLISYDFEEWETFFNYEKPVGWETNQDTIFQSLTKDSDSASGDFAMKLFSESTSGFFGCISSAQTSAVFDAPSPLTLQLKAFVKIIPETAATKPNFVISVSVFNNSTFLDNISYETDTAITEYEEITMDIPFHFVDSLVIRISSGGFPTAVDGCEGHTIAYVDDVSIVENIISSNSKLEEEDFSFYPNPSNGFLNIESENAYVTYQVRDIIGQKLESGVIENGRINLLSKGNLIVVVRTKEGDSKIIRIVNF